MTQRTVRLRVGLDARSLFMPRPRGTARNLLDAWHHIANLRPDWQLILYHQRPAPAAPRATTITASAAPAQATWPAGLAALLALPNVRSRHLDIPGDRWDLWFQLCLPLAAWRDRVDLLHLPANAAPAWCPVPAVVTVHDLTPLTVDARPSRQARAFERGVVRAVRSAAQIIAPSHATRDELCRRFGVPAERVSVIPWAPDRGIVLALERCCGQVATGEWQAPNAQPEHAAPPSASVRSACDDARPAGDHRPFAAAGSLSGEDGAPAGAGATWQIEQVRARYGLRRQWLLNFSGSAPRKNALNLLRAFARLRPDARRDVQLVLVGCEPPSFRRQLAAAGARLGIGERCRLLGFVPHDDLPWLLRGARGMVMPSLAEGFGLPILDAFACGTPVLTSDLSSMPEVAGDAAEYCNPRDPESIAAGMARLLDPVVAGRLRQAGTARLRQFSWERTARLMCEVYERAAARATRAARPTCAAATPGGRQTTAPAAPRATCDRSPVTCDLSLPLNLRLDCRHYRGDRPCAAGVQGACPTACDRFAPLGQRILIIKLGALGDVIRTAALLPGLKESWPVSHITWVTRPAGVRMLANHPLIDRLLPLDAETLCHLEHEQFHLCLSLDKEPGPAGLAMRVNARERRGIGLSPHGTPFPLNPECREYFLLGLDDQRKFFENTKSYPQLLYEALGLKYRGQRYRLYPDGRHRALARAFWARAGVRDDQVLVGLNTGAGRVFANKNWPPEKFIALAGRLCLRSGWRVALFGGPDERERNRRIAAACPQVIDTGCDHDELGFAALLQRSDVLVAGDTMAMHVAIALGVPCVALFGPTCAQEIELYGRGEKIRTGLACAPCYRRACDKSPNCMDDIPVERVLRAIERWAERSRSARARTAPGSEPERSTVEPAVEALP